MLLQLAGTLRSRQARAERRPPRHPELVLRREGLNDGAEATPTAWKALRASNHRYRCRSPSRSRELSTLGASDGCRIVHKALLRA
jgi:hypothetical protein